MTLPEQLSGLTVKFIITLDCTCGKLELVILQIRSLNVENCLCDLDMVARISDALVRQDESI